MKEQRATLQTPPGANVRCVVSVGMLTEGWDANNVTQILGLRAFSSQLLCEQVVGRALRRMDYQVDEKGMLHPEYADIFGVPFEAIPVQGSGKGVRPGGATTTLVQTDDKRKHLAIEFPRVEGYYAEVRERVVCDVDKIPILQIEASFETITTVVRICRARRRCKA